MSNDCNYWRVKFGDGFMHECYIINVYSDIYLFVCLQQVNVPPVEQPPPVSMMYNMQ